MNLDSVSRKTGRQITHGIETAEVHPEDEFGQGTGVGPSQAFDYEEKSKFREVMVEPRGHFLSWKAGCKQRHQ